MTAKSKSLSIYSSRVLRRNRIRPAPPNLAARLASDCHIHGCGITRHTGHEALTARREGNL